MSNPRNTRLTSPAASIAFDDQNDWGSGFIGAVSILNTAGPLTGWTLSFDLAASITNIWNAVIVSHVGTHYVVQNAAWNGALAAGGTVSFGFQADAGNPLLPGSVTWNGSAIGGAIPALPTLSVTGATVQETAAASTALTFTLKLSAPSATPVTVAWSTMDGTALAGRDYDAASGTVTFAAGQTSANVVIATHRGAAGTEAFSLMLRAPTGATIATSQATGTIINPPLPSISVQDITVHENVAAGSQGTNAGAGALLPSGYLHTSGNQIVDAAGHSVRIAAVNWFGTESTTYAPHGLWTASYKTMMTQMVQQGFNAIRLPFSLQTFAPSSTPNGIDFSKNPDLAGLNGLQVMDKIVACASQLGLKIILDDHRSAAGAGPNGDGLWYGDGYSQQDWINTWTMLASHYAGNSTVIGGDLSNEPHGPATWGDGGPNDWAAAATLAGNGIQAVNPNWLILVEGIETYQGQSTWWGGNLQGVAAHPITLNTPNQLVYSPHDYPASIYPQSWFSDPNYPNSLPAVWDKEWGYIAKSGIAPVLVGEFGSKLQSTSDQQWLQQFVKYIDQTGMSGGGQGISWAYWSWNPNSGDTGGILQDDWSTVNTAKIAAIQPAEYHPNAVAPAGSAAAGTASFTVALSAASNQSVSVHYATVDGTAHAGTDYTTISGDLVFAPGETTKIVSTQLFATPGETGQMQFLLALSTPQGGTLANTQASATLVADPAPTAPVTPPSGASVSLDTVNAWAGGYQEGVTIHAGASGLTNWSVEIDTADLIGNLWNATILSHQGDVYRIGNAVWNGTVGANATTSFGFVTDHATGGGLTAHIL
jgi:aryl-phospho-beta-D-glucosidase BglC (GH1 family)